MADTPTWTLEQDSKGEWSWFCAEDGCGWSGHGWTTTMGADREAFSHDCRARVVTPSRTDRQPPNTATQAKGGLSAEDR